MESAFGVDHGEFSKAAGIPNPGKLAGAFPGGQKSARAIGGGAGRANPRMANDVRGVNYKASMGRAKKEGRGAARTLARGGSPSNISAQGAAGKGSEGWRAAQQGRQLIAQPAAATKPAGMRGNISERFTSRNSPFR